MIPRKLRVRFACGLLFLLIILAAAPSHSQQVVAKKIDAPITIDGKLNEEEWEDAGYISGFTQFEPRYGEPSPFTTYIKILYDNKMIYFGIDCRDPEIQKISSRVTRRDGEVYEDDAITLLIDTFNDKNNAYSFQVNSLGTQQDERWADNGRTRDDKWDEKWFSAGSVNENGWTAEVAIPFEVLKFDRKTNEWGFDAIRYVPRNLEQSHWVSGLTEWFRISEFGTITGLDLINVVGKKYTIIPYAQSQLENGKKSTGEVGADVRLNVSSNIGLDAAFNPDFATIEGDVEQVNLTRFELSYPEKRPYFMEGGENYKTRIKQFYSRRIGEIPWGIKLNGKVDKWKLNLLTTQSDPSTAGKPVEPGNDAYYTVFRVTREIKNSSNIGVIGANRNYLDKNKGSAGLISTLFFTKALGMTAQLIKSYGDFDKGSWIYFFRPAYDTKTGHFHVRYTHAGENVRENMNDIGFITDDDRKEVDSNIKRILWINNYGLEEVTPTVNYNRYWSQAGKLRSWELRNSLEVTFLKKWAIDLKYEEEYKLYEKGFRNNVVETELEYDTKIGHKFDITYARGRNYDRDFEQYEGGIELNLSEGWNLSYSLERTWFLPDDEEENSWIHYIRSTYYMNKDLYFKLFYQTKYNLAGGFTNPEFDLDRETTQFVFVWRFLPPFGSVQLAYQEGTTRYTDVTGRGRTLFSKLSWVF